MIWAFFHLLSLVTCASPLNIVILGETGVGKSYLANALLGADLCDEGSGASVTRGSAVHSCMVGDRPIQVIDTEGFGSIESPSLSNLMSIFETTPTPVHLVLLAVNVKSIHRLFKSFTDILDLLQEAFGSSVWRRSVLLFTRSNEVAHETDAPVAAFVRSTNQYLTLKYGSAFASVPGLAVGAKNDDWVVEAWREILRRATNTDSAALSDLAWSTLTANDAKLKSLLTHIATTQQRLHDTHADSRRLAALLEATEEAADLRAKLLTVMQTKFAQAKEEHAASLERLRVAIAKLKETEEAGARILNSNIRNMQLMLKSLRDSREGIRAAKEAADSAHAAFTKVDIFKIASLCVRLMPLVSGGAVGVQHAASPQHLGVSAGSDRDSADKEGFKHHRFIREGRIPFKNDDVRVSDLLWRPSSPTSPGLAETLGQVGLKMPEPIDAAEAGRIAARQSDCRKWFDLGGLACVFAPADHIEDCLEDNLDRFHFCLDDDEKKN